MTSWIMRIWMWMIGVQIERGFRCKGLFVIHKRKDARILIGENFTSNSSFLSNLIGLYQRTIIIARKGGTIKIGNHVGVSGVTIHGTDISIGDHTTIGANTKLFDHDFHAIDYLKRRTDRQDSVVTKAIKIGDDVFIGCNCIVLKGSTIGDRSVVGAGSVVCGVFPNDCVIAGNPARVVKRLEVR